MNGQGTDVRMAEARSAATRMDRPSKAGLLSALAAQTKRLRLGLLVSSNRFRPPAMLSKIAATVDMPVVTIPPEEVDGHFGLFSPFVSMDNPASSALTRERMGWSPTHPGLIADLDEGHYLREAQATT